MKGSNHVNLYFAAKENEDSSLLKPVGLLDLWKDNSGGYAKTHVAMECEREGEITYFDMVFSGQSDDTVSVSMHDKNENPLGDFEIHYQSKSIRNQVLKKKF